MAKVKLSNKVIPMVEIIDSASVEEADEEDEEDDEIPVHDLLDYVTLSFLSLVRSFII
jgi:hypothetical protein